MKFWRKRSVLLFIVFALVVGTYPGWLTSEGTAHAAVGFAGGAGTSEDPYQIATADQLHEIRNNLYDHFVLNSDIDLSAYDSLHPWEPIGDQGFPFSGSLDGQNFKITNFYINNSNIGQPTGLFGEVAAASLIQNLVIEAVEVRGSDNVGVLAGVNKGVIKHVGVTGTVYGQDRVGGLIGLNESEISFSYNTGSVNGENDVGGLVGYNWEGDITSSYTTGAVTGKEDYVGGLVGYNRYGKITSSYAMGNVTGENDRTGGLVGSNREGNIIDSYANGNVTGVNDVGGLVGYYREGQITLSYANGNVTGEYDVGGLVGYNRAGELTFNYATGNVMGEVDVGGITGGNEAGTVSYSYATGHISGCEDVGGLVGDNDDGTISNSYATGSVKGIVCGFALGSDSTGGLVGDNKYGEVTNSYSIGPVTGDISVGGLVGINESGVINNSYYGIETSGQSDNKGQGLSSVEIKDKTNFIGWNFDTVWGADLHHNGYPYLKSIQAFVTYAGNGTDDGGEQFISQSYMPNSSVMLQGSQYNWTKAGFIFNGWNTEADGSGDAYTPGDTLVLSTSILLYANWKQLDAPALTTPMNGQWTNDRKPMISGTTEAGATVAINLDGNVVATVTAAGDGSWFWIPTVELTEGSHTASAGVKDSTGHTGSLSAEHTFTVDTQPPVIKLLGDASIFLAAGTPFVDPGAAVTDLEEGISVAVTGNVNHQVPGTYTLQYDAQDSAGNAAIPVMRTVQVNGWSTGGGSVQLSGNAKLAQLTVKVDGDELALTPAFAASTTSYRVATTADEVSIEAIPSDTRANVTLGTAALVGERTVALAEGDSVLEINVKAENGTVETYRLTIQRGTEMPPEGTACTFRDIKGHWAELNICEALKKGIVEGNSETTFHPQGLITRVEFAAILLRTLGVAPEPARGKLIFTDQDQIPAWGVNSIGAAAENGILHGYPDHSLRPMQPVSRSEMAVMVARAMKWEIRQGQTTSFTDDGDIANWAKRYIYAAAERGLFNGRGGNRFSPSEVATRAEATTLLLRLWHLLDTRPSESNN